MNTRKLSENPHVPAKASDNVAKMQGGNRNGPLVRENVKVSPTHDIAVTAATCARNARKKAPPARKDDLSRLGRPD